jgi:hypothetical protein
MENTLTSEDTNATTSRKIQRWGGMASFVMIISLIAAPLIYLTGNLRDLLGAFAYALADLLYGPVWAISLITAVIALRDRIGDRAPRRMTLALWIAILAGAAMILIASIRSSNRHYHLTHPDLHLESSSVILIAWETILQGITGAGWHFLGWVLILLGSTGWATRALPRVLNILYLVGGAVSLGVYIFPDLEGAAVMLGILWSAQQGFLLWSSESKS